MRTERASHLPVSDFQEEDDLFLAGSVLIPTRFYGDRQRSRSIQSFAPLARREHCMSQSGRISLLVVLRPCFVRRENCSLLPGLCALGPGRFLYGRTRRELPLLCGCTADLSCRSLHTFSISASGRGSCAGPERQPVFPHVSHLVAVGRSPLAHSREVSGRRQCSHKLISLVCLQRPWQAPGNGPVLV
jgi:hypothetical protein